MNRLIFTIILLIQLIPYQAYAIVKTRFEVESVYDGDTVKIKDRYLNYLPLSVRINGIDTPEKGHRAKCEKERRLAIKAKSYLEYLINEYDYYFIIVGWDKYGGRILADLYINNVNVKHTLIKEGLAKEYHGGKKESWCD